MDPRDASASKNWRLGALIPTQRHFAPKEFSHTGELLQIIRQGRKSRINTSPAGHPSCKPSSGSNGNSYSNRAMPSLPQVISCFSMKLPCIGDYISVPHIFQMTRLFPGLDLRERRESSRTDHTKRASANIR